MPADRPATPDRSRRPARRGLLALPMALAAVPAGVLPLALAAAPAGRLPAELRFRVVRQGSAIGTHRVVFAEAGGVLTARTEVAIAVTLLGVTVFRFSHHFEEAWGRRQPGRRHLAARPATAR